MRGLPLVFTAIFTAVMMSTVLPVSADSLDIKSMILMPGPLTLSHAKEEKNCDSCHSNFDKSAQNSKCLTCHEPVAEDQQLKKGFHGLDAMASKNECKSCHTDHKGRDFNIVPFDIDIFDHTHTDFPLLGKHASAACGSCHLPNTAFRDTATTCYGCHREQDKHRGSLGEECGDCHSSDAWNKPETFDHDSTEFPLHGSHVELQCSSCHAGGQYTFDNTQCVACHQLRDVHLGRYGQDCQRCHSEENWTSPVFDHAAETQFPLRGAHHSLTCQACHFGDLKQTKLSTQCVSCHRSSDIHTGRHGDKCDSCHNTTNWDEARFDHAKEANWPLLGKHEKLSCLQCHQGSLKDSPGNQCIDCHRADDAHKTQALNSCGACHQPTGWRDTDGFDHELAQFPLEGMHAVVPCQGCHESDEFHEAKKECVDCHDAEDPHKSALGQQCGSCHTPNGWLLWTFDHNNATDFRLDGAHAHLSCGSCHRGKEAADVPGDCAGCHASEDRHEGRFGRDCSRCHSTESFGAVQWRK